MMETASLTRHKKRQYSFLCPLYKMVTFLNFEEVAAENVITYLKRRQHRNKEKFLKNF